MEIRSYDPSMSDAVIRLSIRAWGPVFESIEEALDPEVFGHFYPDWRVVQRRAVEAACTDEDIQVWVALEDSEVAGFAALKIHAEDRVGEIHMIAVDPGFQRRGIAAGLTRHALSWFEDQGMSVVMVETGGDPGHAPARRAYESEGFRRFPVARYFKKV